MGMTPARRLAILRVLIVALGAIGLMVGGWATPARGAPLAWRELHAPAVDHATMVVDSVTHTLVLFGGISLGQVPRNETWVRSVAPESLWRRLPVTGPLPPGRTDAVIAIDPARHRLILYGGSGPVDCWTLALDPPFVWTPLATLGDVPPGTGIEGFVDPIGDRFLVHQGDQVWRLPLTGSPTWTRIVLTSRVSTAFGFGTRFDGVAALDVARRKLWLTGGDYRPFHSFLIHDDLWSLTLADTASWDSVGAEEYNGFNVIFHDTAGDRLVGGQWDYDLGPGPVRARSLTTPYDETLIDPGPMPAAKPAYDDLDGSLYFHLGSQHNVLSHLNTRNPSGYVRHDLDLGVPGITSIGTNFAYDVRRHRLLAFSGAVWSLDLDFPEHWEPLAIAGTPPSARSNASMILDPVRDRLVVNAGVENDTGAMLGDTWVLELSGTPTWRQLPIPASTPSSMGNAIYDPIHDRMMVYRGSVVSVLDLNDLTGWGDVPQGGRQPAVERRPSVYDPVRETWWFLGVPDHPAAFHVFDDTWLAPPAGLGHPVEPNPTAGVYDPITDRLVLVCGQPLSPGETAPASLFDPAAPSAPPTPLSAEGEPPTGRQLPWFLYDGREDRMIVASGLPLPGYPYCTNSVMSLDRGVPIRLAVTPPDTGYGQRYGHCALTTTIAHSLGHPLPIRLVTYGPQREVVANRYVVIPAGAGTTVDAGFDIPPTWVDGIAPIQVEALGVGSGVMGVSGASVAVHGTGTPPPAILRPFTFRGMTPNPTQDFAWLSFFLPRTADVSIEMFGVDGRFQDRRSYPALAQGDHLLPLAYPRLAPGVYWVRMRVDGVAETRRFVLLR